MPFEVDLLEVTEVPTYQQIANKALHLRQLGMSLEGIGGALGVSHTTAGKAVRWAARPRAAKVPAKLPGCDRLPSG